MIPTIQNFYLGYNSLSAGTDINHLHLECLSIDHIQQLKSNNINSLPIESGGFDLVYECSLFNSNEACNMVSILSKYISI